MRSSNLGCRIIRGSVEACVSAVSGYGDGAGYGDGDGYGSGSGSGYGYGDGCRRQHRLGSMESQNRQRTQRCSTQVV